jgi:hypothetical protein
MSALALTGAGWEVHDLGTFPLIAHRKDMWGTATAGGTTISPMNSLCDQLGKSMRRCRPCPLEQPVI